MKNYLIGIDIGTQGTKAALFDTDLNMVADAFEASKLIQPEPGTVWQEADDLYLSCARTVAELLQKSGIDPMSVAALGMDGQMAGIMGIGADGEASTYYDSWLDTRSSGYVDIIKQHAGQEALRISGGPVTCNHSTKILWWKDNHPDVYKKTAKYVLPHCYLAAKITGSRADKAVYDYTCLHFNNFSDNLNKGWNEALVRDLGVDPDKLPRVTSPFDLQGHVCEAFSQLSGLPAGVPVAVGSGDSAASTFGSGMFEPGMVQDCAGTASIMCSVVDSYVPDTAHETMTMMHSPVDGLWLPLAYINGGGLCLPWFRDNFTGESPATYNELEAQAAAIPAGCEGVQFCPHFCGRMLPADATLKGGFLGLDFKHTRAHLYRSIMEGIACEYAYYMSVIRDNYPEKRFDSIVTIGGGAKSALFNQIKADTLGVTVKTYETGETALVGSAVIGAVAAGVLSDYKTPIRNSIHLKQRYAPNAQNQAVYEQKFASYLSMLDAISPYYKKHYKG